MCLDKVVDYCYGFVFVLCILYSIVCCSDSLDDVIGKLGFFFRSGFYCIFFFCFKNVIKKLIFNFLLSLKIF